MYPSTLLEEVFHHDKKRKIGGEPEERRKKKSQADSYTMDLESHQSILGQKCGGLQEACPLGEGEEGSRRETKNAWYGWPYGKQKLCLSCDDFGENYGQKQRTLSKQRGKQ